MNHDFDPGYTGLSATCNHLLVDAGGYAAECGLPRAAHGHPRRLCEAFVMCLGACQKRSTLKCPIVDLPADRSPTAVEEWLRA